MRHHHNHDHHHHRVDVDESMEDDSDESSNQYGDEEMSAAADQLMDTLLQENRDNDGDIIDDYGQEGDEEMGEDDYDDEIADQSQTIQ